ATILPLGLRGHAVVLSLLLAQPSAKLHSVIPTYADHRLIVGLRKAGTHPVRIGIRHPLTIREMTSSAPFPLGLRLVSRCLRELSKLPNRNLGLSQVKRLRDLHFMLETFTGQ